MSSLFAESLFSFEVVVDSVFLPDVRCRFPAIAFKLLNFPTLIVYMVEPDLANSIQQKVAGSPECELPFQFKELKDSTNRFPFKRGKSSLFKMSANSIHENLLISPLYVMLIDTFPKVPKLLGSCSIPLDVLIESLYDDICQQGLSSPLSTGNRGSFTIYNLMGRAIGDVMLSYRLMSLGTSLIPHIPDSSLCQPEVENKKILQSNIVDSKENSEKINRVAKEEVGIQVLFEDGSRSGALVIDHVEPIVKYKENGKKKKISDSHRIKKPVDMLHTEDPSDLYCPPALYYNSELENNTTEKYPNTYQAFTNEEVWDNFSDSDTIREEDKFSDDDFNITPQVKQAEKKLLRHAELESAIKLVREQKASMQQFPLLTALLDELSVLKQQKPEKPDPVPPSQPVSPPAKKREPKINEQCKQPAHQSVCHHCVPNKITVPKTKSWIQEQPIRSVRKSKLTCGLTHTQRLRLSKGNSDYLKELEKMDQDRREKMRTETRDKYAWLNRTRTVSKGNDKRAPVVDDFTDRHLQSSTIGIQTGDFTLAENSDRLDNLVRSGSPILDNDIVPEPEVRPQPTPRKSLTKIKYLPLDNLTAAAGSLAAERTQSQKAVAEPKLPVTQVESTKLDTANKTKVVASSDQKDGTLGKPTPNDSKHASNRAEALVGANETIGEDPGETLQLQRFVEAYSDDDSDDNKSNRSKSDDSFTSPDTSRSDFNSPKSSEVRDGKKPQQRQTAGLNPPTSDLSPVVASTKNAPLAIRQPVLGLSSTVDVSASLDSTAHIRASDVHSALSIDIEESSRKVDVNDKKPPIPTPRRSLDRQHSLVAESTSSVVMSETGSTHSPGPDDGHYVSDFESEDDYSSPRRNNPEVVKKVSDLKLDPSAKFGYTWSGNQ